MSTYEKVKKIILEHLDVNEADIHPGADFMEDLGADSLDVAELIMSIEDEFNLEINEEDLEGLRTVDDVVDYLDKL